jgi:glycosyltransferase involved in cell wall biosynthesis
LGDPPTDEPLGPLDPGAVVAVVPCHWEPPSGELLERIRRHVGGLVVVDDGSPDAWRIERAAAEARAELIRLPANAGKGHAIAASLRLLLRRETPPEAVLILDSDGQHPPEAIPAFLAQAGEAELVIGDRFENLDGMPLGRRVANRLASRLLSLATGRPVRDSQCGMRLLRGRALTEVSFPPGRFEAETRHLKRCLRSGLRVAWVPIPTLYGPELSAFRALRDSARVLRALVR